MTFCGIISVESIMVQFLNFNYAFVCLLFSCVALLKETRSRLRILPAKGRESKHVTIGLLDATFLFALIVFDPHI